MKALQLALASAVLLLGCDLLIDLEGVIPQTNQPSQQSDSGTAIVKAGLNEACVEHCDGNNPCGTGLTCVAFCDTCPCPGICSVTP